MIRKGTYILRMGFDEDLEVAVGSLGTCRLPAGEYSYVGSAMGGLDQRISRHMAPDKRLRWHIDRLTTVADRGEAFESEGSVNPECSLAAALLRLGAVPSVKGFGCSDCGCRTHLFMVGEGILEEAVRTLGLKRFQDRQGLPGEGSSALLEHNPYNTSPYLHADRSHTLKWRTLNEIQRGR
jgi:Uri superfamily endonuclease